MNPLKIHQKIQARFYIILIITLASLFTGLATGSPLFYRLIYIISLTTIPLEVKPTHGYKQDHREAQITLLTLGFSKILQIRDRPSMLWLMEAVRILIMIICVIIPLAQVDQTMMDMAVDGIIVTVVLYGTYQTVGSQQSQRMGILHLRLHQHLVQQ